MVALARIGKPSLSEDVVKDRNPLSLTVIISGVIIAVIAAIIIGEGRFAPPPIPPTDTPTTFATPTATSNVTNTPEPPPTIQISATPNPSPTPISDTPVETILEVGQIWRQGGLELYLESTELYTGSMCEGPGVVLNFYLSNRRSSEVLIGLRPDTFSAVDDLGNRFKLIWVNQNAHFWGEIDSSFVLGSGSTVPLPHPNNGIDVICIQADIANLSMSQFTVTASNLSSITQARWRVPINR